MPPTRSCARAAAARRWRLPFVPAPFLVGRKLPLFSGGASASASARPASRRNRAGPAKLYMISPEPCRVSGLIRSTMARRPTPSGISALDVIRPFRWKIALTYALTLVEDLLELSYPWATGVAINGLIEHDYKLALPI